MPHRKVRGGGGIRTHGTQIRHNGFRDRPIQPLWHPTTTLPYTTLTYITLPYTTLPYTTLTYITLTYIALTYIAPS